MSFKARLHDYAIWHEVNGHSSKTIKWYRYMLTTFEDWLKANDRPTDISEITLADARAFLLAEQQRTTLYPNHPTGVERDGQLSDRTLHGYARSIRAFFRWLAEEEYLDSNPMKRLNLPKLSKRMKEVVSPAEVERLLAELNPRSFLGARMYAMIAVFYDTGVRASELAGVDLGDVHWGDYRLRVLGKGKKERFVPFSPATQKALRKYLDRRERFAPEGQQALFITTEGRRVTQDNITRMIKRLGQRAGIERLHPHLLRHSAAVAYLLNGGDQFGLKRILGHEQLSTTDQYVDYAQQHLQEQHKRASPMAKVNERKVATTKRRKV